MDLGKRPGNLPTETMDLKDIIREQALPKLPAKSLLRFLAVCQDWKLQISAPIFHHNQSLCFRGISGIFCQTPPNAPVFIPIHPRSAGVPDPSLSFLPEPVVIRTSSNGLLCCQWQNENGLEASSHARGIPNVKGLIAITGLGVAFVMLYLCQTRFTGRSYLQIGESTDSSSSSSDDCQDWKLQISAPIFHHNQSLCCRSISGIFCQTPPNAPVFIPIHPRSAGVPDPSLSFLPEPVVIRTSSNGLLCCQWQNENGLDASSHARGIPNVKGLIAITGVGVAFVILYLCQTRFTVRSDLQIGESTDSSSSSSDDDIEEPPVDEEELPCSFIRVVYRPFGSGADAEVLRGHVMFREGYCRLTSDLQTLSSLDSSFARVPYLLCPWRNHRVLYINVQHVSGVEAELNIDPMVTPWENFKALLTKIVFEPEMDGDRIPIIGLPDSEGRAHFILKKHLNGNRDTIFKILCIFIYTTLHSEPPSIWGGVYHDIEQAGFRVRLTDHNGLQLIHTDAVPWSTLEPSLYAIVLEDLGLVEEEDSEEEDSEEEDSEEE